MPTSLHSGLLTSVPFIVLGLLSRPSFVVAESLTGYSRKKVIGHHYNQVLKFALETGGKPSADFIAQAMASNRVTTMAENTLLVAKDGRKIPVADSAAPIKNIDGKIIGCVVVFRDITHDREVDKAKSEFVSLASHQLRTPPTSMKWFLEMLLSGEVGELNPKQKEYFEEVYRNNQRMITLVNTLLNVSRIELGVFAIEPEKTNVVSLIKGILEEFGPQIHEKELHINEKYSKALQSISVDPKLLRIAIQNLISNSVKYTPPKGNITVEVSLKRADASIGGRTVKKDSLTVVVSDTGYGIPKDQQGRIFTKLFRADNVRAKDTDGTGLGLYDLGYLDRPKVQSRSKLPSSHIVYSLGKQGVEAVFGDAGQYQAVLRRLREIERSLPLIAHALMISQFKVCLTLATRKRDDLKLERWLQGYDLKYALMGRHGENPELVPDAFFVLGHGGYEYPVFLEVDRGTMTEERFVNKLKLYWRWWREERIKDTLGFTNFRVLTVTPNETRSENLRIASKEANTDKKGSNMFLFTPDKNYSIVKPETIFEPIWKSPKDDLPKTIL